MKNQTVITPNLRFKKYKNSWSYCKAGELFMRRAVKGIEGTPVYSVSQGNRELVPRKSIARRMKEDAKAQKNFIVQPNDVAYNTMRMWQGAMGIAPTLCMVSPAYVVLNPTELTDSQFYTYLLKTPKYLHALKSFSYGLTEDRLRLYYKNFSQIVLPNTTIEEQKKIADFLSAIDKKISQLKKKNTLLQQYKKGLIQQLFSQKMRFKDDNGNAFPDWQETRISELLNLQLNSIKMLDNEEYELITVRRRNGGVDSRGLYKGKDVLVKTQFELMENQFVISKRQIVHGACGVVPANLKDAIVSNEYNVFDPVPAMVDIHFFNLFSKTMPMRKAYFINSDGVHIEKLLFKTKSWLKTKVIIPCVEEQKKIVRFIGELDKKMDHVGEQIEQTKQFKKGLLQQMFV